MSKLFCLCARLLIFCMIYFCLIPVNSFAASGGARPVSLGSAFVAVSDDANAALWNPAGLAWQQYREFSYSGIFSKRGDYIPGDFISDDTIVYAQPVHVDYRGDFDQTGGLGVYFLNSGYENDSTRAKQTLWQPGIAYGRVFGNNETMAWGVSVNFQMYDSETPEATASDSAVSLNAGYLWYLNSRVTLALLVENINEPLISLYGVGSRIVRIWRPAIAFYFGDSTMLTLEIYDAAGNTKNSGSDYSQNIRAGLEQYLSDEVSMRLGAHNLNSEVDSSKYLSFGLGWMRSDFFNLKQIYYYLDYTFVYWTDPVSDMEDYTHQLGFTVKF